MSKRQESDYITAKLSIRIPIIRILILMDLMMVKRLIRQSDGAKYYLPSDVPESAIPKQYYFVMLSNPVADTDSDNDGYHDDIDDLNPLEFDCYDF